MKNNWNLKQEEKVEAEEMREKPSPETETKECTQDTRGVCPREMG